MKYRRRIYYSAKQRAEIWDRWKRGESMSSIGRVFERESSPVYSVISPTGGIRPPDRKRSKHHLSLAEREEISRSLSNQQSFRTINKWPVTQAGCRGFGSWFFHACPLDTAI